MTKFSASQSTFECALDKHVTAIIRKIACHIQAHPAAFLHVAQPVFMVLAVLAPTVEQYVKRKIRMAVVETALQPVTDVRQFDFFVWFHYLPLSLEVGSMLDRCWTDVGSISGWCFGFARRFVHEDLVGAVGLLTRTVDEVA